MTMAARFAALLGITLWGLVSAYLFTFLQSGFVDLTAPGIYLCAMATVGGLVLNSLLLKRERILTRSGKIRLVMGSLCLSVIPAAVFAYMAFDLGS